MTKQPKLSKVLGLKRKINTYNEDFDGKAETERHGYNQCLKDLNHLSPDVEALIDIIRNQYTDEHELAKNIIYGIGKWIKKG